MQKKQYWNVKTLVFMALLIAMHLVLTRVLVIDLGAYRISVGSVCTILAGLCSMEYILYRQRADLFIPYRK